MAASCYVLASGTADTAAVGFPCKLLGFSIHESAASAAVASLYLRDGSGATGDIRVALELLGDQSATMWFGPQGIQCNTGIYVDRVAGTTEGVIYFE